MVAPELVVLDLTAQTGLHALAELGVGGKTRHGRWEGLTLGGATHSPRISWYRPAMASDLRALTTRPKAMAILVGPGSLALLAAVLSHHTVCSAPALWIFILPNAAMEEAEISKHLTTYPNKGTYTYRMPYSDPQSLWFVLMEQLGKVQKINKHINEEREKSEMTTNLKKAMEIAMTIDGALAAALVDYRSGMCLAQAGGGMNLELAAAGNTQVVRAKLKTMESLGIRRGMEDILITLADQFHLIRLVPNHEGLFLYLVLDRHRGNLALARFKLTDLERSLKV